MTSSYAICIVQDHFTLATVLVKTNHKMGQNINSIIHVIIYSCQVPKTFFTFKSMMLCSHNELLSNGIEIK